MLVLKSRDHIVYPKEFFLDQNVAEGLLCSMPRLPIDIYLSGLLAVILFD